MKAYEVNFDGIVGPTHNYGGLSYGNTASATNRFKISNPREAALQGLKKMKFLADKGIKQAVLPPQERPFIPILRQLGFKGSDRQVIKNVYNQVPDLLLNVSSAACMWTANAATVSPSADSADGLLHLTPANLCSKFHRAIECETTASVLKAIFNDPKHFMVHDPLLAAGSLFSDEGAANHNRFCQTYGMRGIQLFVFGRFAFQPNPKHPKKFPARQTQETSEAISRLHGLDRNSVIFAQQHPDAIDAGAFHNDVVSVANQNVFLFHEQAFLHKRKLMDEIRRKVTKECSAEMIFLEVKAKDISLKDAVSSYFFNSQLITLTNGSMALIAPVECQENAKIRKYIDALIQSEDNPIAEAAYIDLRQSMQNGGGPACLRLRVVMTEKELEAAHQAVFLTDALYFKLREWVESHYRDRLQIEDLADPDLHEESNRALNALSHILNL